MVGQELTEVCIVCDLDVGYEYNFVIAFPLYNDIRRKYLKRQPAPTECTVDPCPLIIQIRRTMTL